MTEVTPEFLASLATRIRDSRDFSAQERGLIIDALALGDYRGKHEYPSGHGPGSRLSATVAWSILDQLPPTAMKRWHRFMLAGLIAGALEKVFMHAGITIETLQ